MKIARGPGLELYRGANGRWHTLPPERNSGIQSSPGGCICRSIQDGRLFAYSCPCHPAREGERQGMTTTPLSNSERTICAQIGIDESQYLAQRGRNNTTGSMTAQINPALKGETRAAHRAAKAALPAPEREIAIAMNLDPRDYAARRVSQRLGTAAMRQFASGIDGRAIIEEARLEHADDINDDAVSTEDLVAEAREALEAFDVADDESWRKLAFAAACVQGALERHAPPYATREPYGSKAEADRRRG